MNKKELVNLVAKKSEMTKKDVEQVIDNVLETIQDVLVSGEDVKLTGYFNLTKKERKQRMGRNPRNGEEVIIPASNYVSFKAGKGLKDAVK